MGIDIGGTFTDFVLLEQTTGRVMTGKVLTRVDDLAGGVLHGVHELLTKHRIAGAHIRKVVHGTTLATNALIERRGARTALIVTRGFRDLLELARESRYDIFDIDLAVPKPLVPRRHVFEVTERLAADGSIVEPLAIDEVGGIVRLLRAESIQAVAVCLLHSFRNPDHERQVAAALHAMGPELAVSLSSDVMPDLREYERASTSVANAYLQPVIRSYLDRLADGLRATGIAADLMLIGSDAGTLARDGCFALPRAPRRIGPSRRSPRRVVPGPARRRAGRDRVRRRRYHGQGLHHRWRRARAQRPVRGRARAPIRQRAAACR